MATAKLTIAGQGGSTEVALDANGAIIGRSPSCDAVLDSGRVSRRHARIFQDPFGRWIVEDLGSRNGVTIGGQRIGARAVLPGEKIVVGPFSRLTSITIPLSSRSISVRRFPNWSCPRSNSTSIMSALMLVMKAASARWPGITGIISSAGRIRCGTRRFHAACPRSVPSVDLALVISSFWPPVDFRSLPECGGQ